MADLRDVDAGEAVEEEEMLTAGAEIGEDSEGAMVASMPSSVREVSHLLPPAWVRHPSSLSPFCLTSSWT